MSDKQISFTNSRNVIVDHLKKKNDWEERYIYLTPNTLELLRQVKEVNERMQYPDKEYLFRNEEGRTTSRQIA
jgi:hypothetical protein